MVDKEAVWEVAELTVGLDDVCKVPYTPAAPAVELPLIQVHAPLAILCFQRSLRRPFTQKRRR